MTLSWQAPTARDRPLRYVVERNGKPLAFVGAATSYSDRSMRPGSRYAYTVRAIDLAGARSPASTPVTVSVPPAIQLADDFETGTLVNWDTVGVSRSSPTAARSATVYSAWNCGTLLRLSCAPPDPRSDFTVRFRFQLLDQGPAPVRLLALATASGDTPIALGLTSSGRLAFRAGSVVVSSQQIIAIGTWYDCLLDIRPNQVWAVTCHDEATLDEGIELLTIPLTETDYVTIVIGQTDGTPRAVVLVDDLIVRSAESGTDTGNRTWAWGISRGRS